MKLNNLTNQLKTDSSKSYNYLCHIVELLREQVETLQSVVTRIEPDLYDHIEKQKILVETGTVDADLIITRLLKSTNINDVLFCLENVVEVFQELKVFGHRVITTEDFVGPFIYKGEVDELPTTSEPGDVYIWTERVWIADGNGGWASFDLPIGMVSKPEYNEAYREIFQAVALIQSNLDITNNNLANHIQENIELFETVDQSLLLLDENKLDKNPEDDKVYVRQNDKWVESAIATNVVPREAGTNIIENTPEGISITGNNISLVGENITIEGYESIVADDFSLNKNTTKPRDNHYILEQCWQKYENEVSSCIWRGDTSLHYLEQQKSPPNRYTIFTKNYEYFHFNLDNKTDIIAAIDKNGNVIENTGDIEDLSYLGFDVCQKTNMFTFDQEYVPEGFDDTIFIVNNGSYKGSAPLPDVYPRTCWIAMYKDGRFFAKYNLPDNYPSFRNPGESTRYAGLGFGKSLKRKVGQRILYLPNNAQDTSSTSPGVYSTVGVIIGGTAGDTTSPFDPSKSFLITLPANAIYGAEQCFSTDEAWYCQAKGTIIRITPDGNITTFALPNNTLEGPNFNYMEYTTLEGRPGAVFANVYQVAGAYIKSYICFIEEGKSPVIQESLCNPFWANGNFRFTENTNYIFLTLDSGAAYNSLNVSVNNASKNGITYWDKKTKTQRFINNIYPNAPLNNNGVIEMFKTKGGAIWLPYLANNMQSNQRDGIIKYIKDVDYTNIDPVTGLDVGAIPFFEASVGVNHAFFTAGANSFVPKIRFINDVNNNTSFSGKTTQMAATNDDGILCIVSGDLMAYALCWGDGNIKVYECSDHDISQGWLRFDNNKRPLLPASVPPADSVATYVSGMSHGWILQLIGANGFQAYTYIGCHYIDDNPTILVEPHLTKILSKYPVVKSPHFIKHEKYGYLQTSDDFEKRKLVVSGVRINMPYSCTQTFGMSAFIEKRVGVTESLELKYQDRVLSSVEL